MLVIITKNQFVYTMYQTNISEVSRYFYDPILATHFYDLFGGVLMHGLSTKVLDSGCFTDKIIYKCSRHEFLNEINLY